MIVDTGGDAIHIVVELSVPRMQAWTLLTEKQHIASWWGDHVDIQARPGGMLSEVWSHGERVVVTSGLVTRCDPPSVLEMTWADNGWAGETRVSFHLSEHGNGTRLEFDHSGWSVHPAGERKKLVEAHAAGWSRYLTRLAEYSAVVGG